MLAALALAETISAAQPWPADTCPTASVNPCSLAGCSMAAGCCAGSAAASVATALTTLSGTDCARAGFWRPFRRPAPGKGCEAAEAASAEACAGALATMMIGRMRAEWRAEKCGTGVVGALCKRFRSIPAP